MEGAQCNKHVFLNVSWVFFFQPFLLCFSSCCFLCLKLFTLTTFHFASVPSTIFPAYAFCHFLILCPIHHPRFNRYFLYISVAGLLSLQLLTLRISISHLSSAVTPHFLRHLLLQPSPYSLLCASPLCSAFLFCFLFCFVFLPQPLFFLSPFLYIH